MTRQPAHSPAPMGHSKRAVVRVSRWHYPVTNAGPSLRRPQMKSLQASAKPKSMWSLCVVAMCALVMILFSAPGMAQSALGSGRLEGPEVDPSGAVLADATVTARNQATGVSETTKSGADGHFELLYLAPETYEVSIVKSGCTNVVYRHVW